MPLDVRPSPIAGTWYPGDAAALAASVDGYLSQARVEPLEGRLIGVVAPHAGHQYSGGVAGHAFRLLVGLAPEVVVVVSPFHAVHPAPLLTSAHQAYATPLGSVPVDHERLERLGAQLRRAGHDLEGLRRDREHALEIELPFLQRALDRPFRLLPLMVRSHERQTVEALGHALAEVLEGAAAVLVASSDLSHFYPDPLARRFDSALLRRLEAFDPAGVLAAEEQGLGFACGRGAIAAVLWAARDLGADHVRVLHHATSGDVTGDRSSVVGYAAAAITAG